MVKYTDQGLTSFEKLTGEVWVEHLRQMEKWGRQTVTIFEWLAYLTEEVGELSQAISEKEYHSRNPENVRKEAIQVATLALKIAEMMRG